MKPISTPTSLRFFEIDAQDLLRSSAADTPPLHDALNEMSVERCSGVIIRNALPADVIAQAKQALSDNGRLPRFGSPQFAGHSFGFPLVSTGADLTPYFAATVGLQAGFDAAFQRDMVAHHCALFGAMAGGRPVGVPAFRGQSYAAMTVRVLRHTGRLPVHCGNETQEWPSMAHLRTLLDPRDQLSYFTLLQKADAGGELIIYDYRFRRPEERVRGEVPIDMRGEEVPAALEARGTLTADLGEGDMIVFDGGRIFHRVVPVEGETPRWTLGGFMALSANGERVYFWS